MAPAADVIRGLVTTPAKVYTQGMLKEVTGVAPLVVLELPCLSRGKDRNDAVPVLGLELLGAFDENETHRSVGVDGGDDALHVKHRRGGIACGSGYELSVLEEGSRIG